MAVRIPSPCGGIFPENNVAGLFPAEPVAVRFHIFIYVLVSDCGLFIFDSGCVKRLVEAEVGHYGGDHLVSRQLTPLLHVAAIDV